jgi:RNA polymerase sigma-70 factor (ECF subfamily)
MRTTAFATLASLFGSSDEQAMWRVQSGDDEEAFAQLVRRWREPILHLCHRMTGDPHRAEDLAQDTFVRAYAKRREYQPRARFSTWLWRIAVNLCHDELRRTHRRGEISIHDAPDTAAEDSSLHQLPESAPSPDARLVETERAVQVQDALLALAEPYRAVVVLRHYEGLKFREIAEVLEIPEGTVKSRMAEAFTQLACRLRRMPDGHARET